jgi:hypothetical protein
MLPVKVHTYVFDLSEKDPNWAWNHELTKVYKMKDLSPDSFNDLSERLLKHEHIAAEYYST